MSTLHSLIAAHQFNRPRTLGLLDKIEQEKEPQKILGWRPGPGRAHIAWQLTHIGITEELFATERLVPGTKPAFADLVPRFKGGSTPDDEIPQAALIRKVLNESRAHLLETLGRFGDKDLGAIPEALPEPMKQRKLALFDILHIIAWHEPHHQGQAHITLNLYKAQHS
jgi:DinB family protein